MQQSHAHASADSPTQADADPCLSLQGSGPTDPKLLAAIQRGYSQLMDLGVGRHRGLLTWADAWQRLIGRYGQGVTTTEQLLARAGDDALLPLWRDDLLMAMRQMGRHNSAGARCLGLCGDFLARFTAEPVGRLIDVACTEADLIWYQRGDAAGHARYATILSRWPRRRQPMLRHIEAGMICPALGIDRRRCRALLAELAAVQQYRGLDWREHDGATLEESLSWCLKGQLTFSNARVVSGPFLDVFKLAGIAMLLDRGVDLAGKRFFR